jgi:glutamate 5-kinase
MVITLGKRLSPLSAISAGEKATWFLPAADPVAARKKWIAGSLDDRGVLRLDAGAVRALRTGKSLLPAGCTAAEGEFHRGDTVRIVGPESEELGRGLIAYDAAEARAILGRKTHEIEEILGYIGRKELIHRDHMVLRGE